MSNFETLKQFLSGSSERIVVTEDNQTDKICVEVPLFIRLLEFAREEAADDVALHIISENLIKLMKNSDVLSMSDYDASIKGAKIKHGEE